MKRRVLIVEDEMVVQLHLAHLVAELGHDVVGTAMSSGEALALAEREKPELVLMDVHLADGDDGIDVARAIVEREDCAVVFITAYADGATIERSAAAGAAGYLVKPFTAPAVRAAITTALAGHGRLRRARDGARSLVSVVEGRGAATLACDGSDRVLFASRGAARLLGREAADAENAPLLDLLRFPVEHERHRFEDALARVRSGEARVLLQRMTLVCGGGRECAVDVELLPAGEAGDAGLAGAVAVRLQECALESAPVARRRVERRRFGAGTRVLVYSHDTFGLGHLRRCLALVRRLCADHPDVSVLLVTGSPMVHRYALPPGVDYVKLPAVRKVESERYDARSLRISGDTVRSIRSRLILDTLREFDPGVLLVDHAPVGSKGELSPTLDWLREHGGCIRILGLRDVIDAPSEVVRLWRSQGIYDVLRHSYDHVVVYGEREVYDPVTRYEFGEEEARKTRFVHYVCGVGDGGTESDEEHDGDARPMVAVSIGGGDGGAETVILPFLEMMRRFGDSLDFRAEILTGPLSTEVQERELQRAAAGLPVRLRSFVPSAAATFRRAAAVVATAGYNTTVELLANARGAVLVPRVLYRQEQWIRARRFEELGLVSCIHPDELRPEDLLAAVERARDEARLERARAERRIRLDGAERFSRFCGDLEVEVRSAV